MTTPNVPIVNAGMLYLNGMNISNDSVAPNFIVNISAGQARNVSSAAASSNLNDIISSASVAVDIRLSGAGGLDQGSVAAATKYAVFIVGDSTKYNNAAGMFSLSATDPVMPDGYDMLRRIGYVYTDGSSHILLFQQVGSGVDRWMYYDVPFQELTAGTQTAYTAINLASSVPAQATMVRCKLDFTPTNAGDQIDLQPTGATGAPGWAVLSGDVAGVNVLGMLDVPCNATPSIDYKITVAGSADLYVCAYLDQMGYV